IYPGDPTPEMRRGVPRRTAEAATYVKEMIRMPEIKLLHDLQCRCTASYVELVQGREVVERDGRFRLPYQFQRILDRTQQAGARIVIRNAPASGGTVGQHVPFLIEA